MKEENFRQILCPQIPKVVFVAPKEEPIVSEWSIKMNEDIQYQQLKEEAKGFIRLVKETVTRGRPFAFMDFDTSFYPDRLEKQIENYLNKLYQEILDNSLTERDLRVILSPF
jgi:hypothetical protein